MSPLGRVTSSSSFFPGDPSSGVIHGWLDGLLCRFQSHAHSVAGERGNHQGGIPDGERCRRSPAETKTGYSTETIGIRNSLPDTLGQSEQAAGLEASEQEADTLSGSRSGMKETAEIHSPVLDARESGIAGSPDMHLEIMGQFQIPHVAFQSDPRRGLPHAARGPDDPLP